MNTELSELINDLNEKINSGYSILFCPISLKYSNEQNITNFDKFIIALKEVLGYKMIKNNKYKIVDKIKKNKKEILMITIIKRNGKRELLDLNKIKKNTNKSVLGLLNVSAEELEQDAKIKFVDGMKSKDIQDMLIKTAVDKIDIDRPDWTFVAARLFLFDLYHQVGNTIKGEKGKSYCRLKYYIEYGQKENKILSNLQNGFDLDELNDYIKPERDYQFNYLGIKTLYDRYLIKDKNNNPIELPQQMFMGIAMFLAQNEKNKTEKAKEFYDVISKFEVMLATPTLSNARTLRHQLSSCYVGSTPDNIEGIFDSYLEFALLSKYGGGVGWDWNQVRAMTSEIAEHKGASGGIIPFLKIDNDIALAVDQLGTRKGAIAVYIEPWHMDLIDFLDLKKNSGEERRRAHDLFPALWINDLFMTRIVEDGEWTLFDPLEVVNLSNSYGEDFEKKYKYYEKLDNIKKLTFKAKDIWKKILTSYFETGSPFLTFKDRANITNPNKHAGMIRSSNLCTEIFQNTKANYYYIKVWINDGNEFVTFKEDQILVVNNGIKKMAKHLTALDEVNVNNEYKKIYCIEKEKVDGQTAVCNLASINLSKINTKEDFERVIPIAVRMLDNVIDLNFYPLKKVKKTNLENRAIGLGVMGEAELLANKQILFGSQEHYDYLNEIMELYSYNTIKSSIELSKEKGSYPLFKNSNWEKGIFPMDFKNLEAEKLLSDTKNKLDWDKLKEECKKYGIRNGYLMAIAPTSSISILVGTTQSIEPIYKRKWYEENKSGLIPNVVPNLNINNYNFYVSAYDLEQDKIIKAGAVRQKWIDQGQSLNLFFKTHNITGKKLSDIYILAWLLGLKSTYYLRSESPESKIDVQDRSIECSGCQ